MQITDSISKNLTDSDLESIRAYCFEFTYITFIFDYLDKKGTKIL